MNVTSLPRKNFTAGIVTKLENLSLHKQGEAAAPEDTEVHNTLGPQESYSFSSSRENPEPAVTPDSRTRGLRLGAIAAAGLVALGGLPMPAAQAISLDSTNALLQTEASLLPMEVLIDQTAFQIQQPTSGWNFDLSLVETISPVWNFADGAQGESVFNFHRSSDTPTAPYEPVKKAEVTPLAQSNSLSCGQTSVAMAVNSLKGTRLRDTDIHRRYGFSLLGALNAESASVGVRWNDAGNFSAPKWSVIERALKQKMPVVIGLNGPEFSPTGRGHIVTIVGIEGEKVSFADPAKGVIRQTTRRNIERAPAHPHGKFIFVPSRTGPGR